MWGPWFLMVPFPAAASVVIDVHFAGTGPQATPDADTGIVEAASAVVGWAAWCFALRCGPSASCAASG